MKGDFCKKGTPCKSAAIVNHAISQIDKHLSQQAIQDRRLSPRFGAYHIPGFKIISQVGGPEVKLINISRGGALIESAEHILPGPSTTLRILTAEAVHLIEGRIIHYGVSSLKNRMPQYQAVVIFNEDFTILPAGPGKEFTSHP